jgi:hypothetical protein
MVACDADRVPVLRPNHSQVACPPTKPFQRPPAAVADLMKTLTGRVYLANAFSCVHLQGETVSCG